MNAFPLFPYTHHIVSMTYGLTKNSQSPMWRCATADGEKVNIFQHPDPAKDNAHLFGDYLPEMITLVPQQQITWKNHPILVSMIKDNGWWTVTAVGPRPEGAQPDPVYAPKKNLYVAKAVDWAQYLRDLDGEFVVWDTETTGLADDDEIVSIAVINAYDDVLINTLIRPEHPERLLVVDPKSGQSAADVTGITPELVALAPPFSEVYKRLFGHLSGNVWALYNAAFDCRMLEQACVRNDLVPLASIGINDVMDMFSLWYGEWTPVYRHFVSKSLGFAAEQLGISATKAHDALDDASTTLRVIEALARQEELPCNP